MSYDKFLSAITKKQWERVGLKRRAGVAVPLFSLYSLSSIGIGELRDLKLLVDWCKMTGMSIIQLLPLNDVGFNFRPYDAQSTFALEPMYLAIEALRAVRLKSLGSFGDELRQLRKSFPLGGRRKRVNYKIKQAKLELLWKIFKDNQEFPRDFQAYVQENSFWIEDYAFFKVIKEKNEEKGWEFWGSRLRQRNIQSIKSFEKENLERLKFHKWLQWQLFEQFKMVREYAKSKDVLLMGDLPFLVCRDSADVWARQGYFKLDLVSGAPADMYFANGQRWGMPVYNWENIAKNDYDYLKEKLKYAENFYDLFRIDHAVGMFRIWTIPLEEPLENAGLRGTFEPKDESIWEAQGRKLLSLMAAGTKMLPCAEDLGVVPACSNKVLEEFGIPGTEVQRWTRDWGRTYNFKPSGDYRKNSIATVSTHDSSTLCAWWEYEAGTVDEKLFERRCLEAGINLGAIKNELFDSGNSFHGRLRWNDVINSVDILLKVLGRNENQAVALINLYRESCDEKKKFCGYLGISNEPEEKCSHELIRMALEKINSSASIFSIQLLQDWMSIDCLCEGDVWEMRINFPGTLSNKNWSLVTDLSLEEILTLPINNVIKNMNSRAERI